MSTVTNVTKHFTTQIVEETNTCSYIPIHVPVQLCVSKPTWHVFSYSSHHSTGSERHELVLIGTIFYTVLNLPFCSTCRNSSTFKRSINSLLLSRKFSVSSERPRSFRLYLTITSLFLVVYTK